MTHDLETVQREVIALYESERYREALSLSLSVQEAFPANASYWSACLLSLMGEHGESLTTLERALAAGCWWSPLTLRRDPDLEPLRGDDRFTRVVEASEVGWRAGFRAEPELQMFPPKAASTGVLVIALHGSQTFSLDDFAAKWEPLTSAGFPLVVPRSTQAENSDGGATWDDRTQTERDVRLAFERAQARFATTRVVIGGFSAGGLVAISASVAGRPALEPVGFIAVGAPIDPEFAAALDRTDPSLRGWITVGEEDPARDASLALAEQARAVGLPWRIETVPGLGHRIPDDFASRSRRAMDFLLAAPRD
jgi:predicted esterase